MARPTHQQSDDCCEADSHNECSLQDPQWNPQTKATFEAATKPKARLDTVQLVGALNEQLQERNAGNACYKAKRWSDAMSAWGCGAGLGRSSIAHAR